MAITHNTAKYSGGVLKYKWDVIKFKWEFKNRGDKKILTIRFTHDFVNYKFIIECKGRANESFPMRWKLFKRMINISRPYVTLYKPQNQKECDQVIELITKNK